MPRRYFLCLCQTMALLAAAPSCSTEHGNGIELPTTPPSVRNVLPEAGSERAPSSGRAEPPEPVAPAEEAPPRGAPGTLIHAYDKLKPGPLAAQSACPLGRRGAECEVDVTREVNRDGPRVEIAGAVDETYLLAVWPPERKGMCVAIAMQGEARSRGTGFRWSRVWLTSELFLRTIRQGPVRMVVRPDRTLRGCDYELVPGHPVVRYTGPELGPDDLPEHDHWIGKHKQLFPHPRDQ